MHCWCSYQKSCLKRTQRLLKYSFSNNIVNFWLNPNFTFQCQDLYSWFKSISLLLNLKIKKKNQLRKCCQPGHLRSEVGDMVAWSDTYINAMTYILGSGDLREYVIRAVAWFCHCVICARCNFYIIALCMDATVKEI